MIKSRQQLLSILQNDNMDGDISFCLPFLMVYSKSLMIRSHEKHE